MGDVFHDGELDVQRQAGVREQAERVGRVVQSILPPGVNEHLRELPFVVVGGQDDAGRCWATLVAGEPGFASGPYPNRVELDAPPLPNDPLLAGLSDGTPVGLLAINAMNRARLRVNGPAECVTDMGFAVRVNEAYGNCPKYIQQRQVTYDALGSEPGQPRVTDALTDAHRSLIERADTFFIASSHEQRGADVSHRGGMPGFVRVDDGGRLVWPDYAGNNLFQTLGNLAIDPQAGLLFLNFESRGLLQLTGRVRVDWDAELARRLPGAQRVFTFEPQAVVDRTGVLPLTTQGCSYSPHNPPAGGGSL